MAGYGCETNSTLAFLNQDILNQTTILSRNTFLLENITDLVDPYILNFYDIKLNRTQAETVLRDCDEQVCDDIDRPYKCLNGMYFYILFI